MANLSKYKKGQWFPGNTTKRKSNPVKPSSLPYDSKQSGQSGPPDTMSAKLAIYGHVLGDSENHFH